MGKITKEYSHCISKIRHEPILIKLLGRTLHVYTSVNQEVFLLEESFLKKPTDRSGYQHIEKH